ncbi:MAG: erythromycin esterase family protein [Clostridium sulfidigenes]|uniref:Erythromycin esterase family protein n=1 Tax=Clostridium sulfidigenes TaxID=318464 RepID=A0A927ZL88_9CLOT|nr:erythromycin esterase family protein [Clostridium sulfidigenes]
MSKVKKVIVLLIIIMGLLGGTIIYIRPISEKQYVQKNADELNLQNYEDYSDLNFLDEDIKDKKVVFTNEVHGADENADVQYKFASYLIDNWDCRYLLLEMGYAEGEIINKYIQTGDEELLKNFSNIWQSKFNNISYIEYLKKLHVKNKDLPQDKKIIIKGVDSIENSEATGMYIDLLIEDNPDLSKEQIAALNSFKKQITECIISDQRGWGGEENIKNILSAVKEISDIINENNKSYKEALGENLFSISFILNNIKNSQDFNFTTAASVYSDKEWYETRDKYTYENFKKLDEYFKMDKCYMHYGVQHAYQREINGVKFLAAYLDEDEKLKDKVYSINTIYGDGTIFEFQSYSPTQYFSISYELREILNGSKYEGKDIFIDLNNRKSTFSKELTPTVFTYYDSAMVEKEVFYSNKGVTTDYFQGVILINKPTNVEPAIPVGN